jgi:ribosomal protein S18 acetylase RimI-like enzyme
VSAKNAVNGNKVSAENGPVLFSLDRLVFPVGLDTFSCQLAEYSDWLAQEALHSQGDLVVATYLLHERETGAIAAYMALVADAIKLSVSEKELHNLNYPFKTIPAMKIAKLAVASSFREKYSGIGSYMIQLAIEIARVSNETQFSCRFVTADADVERDMGLLDFYTKNGFVSNVEMNNKRSKTINMRKDILERS